MTSLPSPASPGKPKLGESNGDREYLMQVLRAATARVKLTSNTLDSIDPLFDSIDSATGYQRPANAPTRPYYDIMPSTQDVRDYLGQPQTDAGKKAQTLGEILPFALGAPVAMRHMAGKAMGPIADTLGSYMPPEALWSLLAGAAAIPAGWAAARPQYTKPTTDIFLKSHFGGTSPQYGAGSCRCLSWWSDSIQLRLRYSDVCDSAGLSWFDVFDGRLQDCSRTITLLAPRLARYCQQTGSKFFAVHLASASQRSLTMRGLSRYRLQS